MTVNLHTNTDTLFAYLEDRGIRQTWLAEQLGMSYAYLTHIKTGRRAMPADFPEKASAALGLPVFLLFPTTTVDEEPAHV